MNQFRPLEKHFFSLQDLQKQTTNIPYLVLESFLQLGLINLLRFLEGASESPQGVISLPIGKTPEYFI